MILLTPVIMLTVFGSMLYTGSGRDLPVAVRPWLALGAVTITMFSLLQITQNLFGFDRHGFRVFVLSPARRREILLGKNLSIAPLVAALSVVTLVVLQIVFPLRLSHLLATLVQTASMYIILSMLGNLVSIMVPMALSTGSLKPAKPKLTTALVHMLCMFALPLAMAPICVPLAAGLLLEQFGWGAYVPVYFLLSLALLALLVWIYNKALGGQGRLLQSREQKILAAVTAAGE